MTDEHPTKDSAAIAPDCCGLNVYRIDAASMTWETSRSGNGKCLLLADMVLNHRLAARDPFEVDADRRGRAAVDRLLAERGVLVPEAATLVAGKPSEEDMGARELRRGGVDGDGGRHQRPAGDGPRPAQPDAIDARSGACRHT